MGLILRFRAIPAPRRLHDAHHCLPAGMDVDVLHGHLLLALAAVAVERFEQLSEGARELVRLGEVLAPTFEGLLAEHGAPIAFHRRVMSGDQLRCHHALQFVLRADADERRGGGAVLLVPRLGVRVLQPKRVNRLVGEDVVPIVGPRAADSRWPY